MNEQNTLTAKENVEVIKEALQAHFPYVNAYHSTLGGADKASILITVSLNPKETWTNGYIENSDYARIHLSYSGRLEHFSGYGCKRLRKSRVKTIEEAINKVKKITKGE